MGRLPAWKPTDGENRKLPGHLRTERDALRTVLKQPKTSIPATNHWSEQAIRPAVVNRKAFGGHRTRSGAHVLKRQISLFQTCHHQRRNPTGLLVDLLRSPDPIVLEALAPPWITRQPKPPPPPA